MIRHNSDDDLGQPLAIGGTAEIYPWRAGWILKLFFRRFQRSSVEYEQRIARAIGATGLKVPNVGEIVAIRDRFGLVYQECTGAPMDQKIAQEPDQLGVYARLLADLHLTLHAEPVHVEPVQADIPQARAKLAQKISAATPLPDDLRAAALELLATLPDGDQLCHGDFHPGNVLMSEPAPVIIDWNDAVLGRPAADVARTSVLLLGYASLLQDADLQHEVQTLHEIYRHHYFEQEPNIQAEYQRWLPIMAAARLADGLPDCEPWLLTAASQLRSG